VKPPAAITTPTTVKPTPVPAQRASTDELKMEVLSRLGDSDVDAEDWWRAVLNYRQALMYGQRAHASQAKLCSINSGLSIAYAGLRQFAKAIEYGKQSLNAALAENPKDMIDISIAYNNLGYLHRATKDFTGAQRYYEQALKTAPTASWEARVRAATIESNLSELYALTNQPQKALNGYRHALRVFQTEMPKNTELIREIKRRIELIELRRPLAMSKYPISVVIVKANI
jgi:tetratricopeptide (TPR) repeat protein